ncbi:hypothetical protein [Pseudonocardia sp. ICBG601]|uniref:hypothetical protein n=1 Tax=Pseudonocardia sp. ICBG601 TaxID=2846759 RepID=UPI001CF617EA|nr:hypothetical protein [Pseudonocardia sp. ICBG601]
MVSLHPCPDLGAEFFPHASQAIKLVRRRRPLRPGGRWKTETVYAITSLTGTDADPGSARAVDPWALVDRESPALGP